MIVVLLNPLIQSLMAQSTSSHRQLQNQNFKNPSLHSMKLLVIGRVAMVLLFLTRTLFYCVLKVCLTPLNQENVKLNCSIMTQIMVAVTVVKTKVWAVMVVLLYTQYTSSEKLQSSKCTKPTMTALLISRFQTHPLLKNVLPSYLRITSLVNASTNTSSTMTTETVTAVHQSPTIPSQMQMFTKLSHP